MVKVEVQGIEISLTDDKLDDWELLELLRDYDKGNGGLIVDIMQLLLGEKQYNALKTAIKKNEGRVSSKSMLGAFNAIMEASKDSKN